MKKLIYLLLIIPLLAIGITADNGWRQVGNTLNRTVDGFKYSTILGASPGRAYWYQLYQVDSLITAVRAQIPTSLPLSGTAGGDLTGTYPNPTVNTINSITKTFYDPTSSIQTQLNARLKYTDTAAMLSNYIGSKKSSTVNASLSFAPTYTIKALNSDASYTSFQGNGMVSTNGGQVIFSGNNVIINGYSTFIESGGYTYLEAVGGVGLYSPVPFLDTTTVQTRHIIGYGNSPTIAAGTAAGTSPTVALVNATDLAGEVDLTTGSSTTTGTLLTVTFQRVYALPPHIALQGYNSNTTSIYGTQQVTPATATNGFTIQSLTTGLTAATVYKWHYIIAQ